MRLILVCSRGQIRSGEPVEESMTCVDILWDMGNWRRFGTFCPRPGAPRIPLRRALLSRTETCTGGLARRQCAHAHKDKDHHRGHSRSSHGLMAQSDEYRGSWSRDLRAPANVILPCPDEKGGKPGRTRSHDRRRSVTDTHLYSHMNTVVSTLAAGALRLSCPRPLGRGSETRSFVFELGPPSPVAPLCDDPSARPAVASSVCPALRAFGVPSALHVGSWSQSRARRWCRSGCCQCPRPAPRAPLD